LEEERANAVDIIVRVARARNLTAANVTGASDPYVVAFVCAMRDSSSTEATVVGEAEEAAGNNKPSAGPSGKVIHKSLVDDDSVAKRRGEVRTKAVEDTIDPEWNETLVLNTVTKRECVCLRVKDFDSYGDGGDSDDKLGGLTLSLEDVLSYAADAGGGDASGASVGDNGSAGMGRWLRLEGEGAGDGELCIRFECSSLARGGGALKSKKEQEQEQEQRKKKPPAPRVPVGGTITARVERVRNLPAELELELVDTGGGGGGDGGGDGDGVGVLRVGLQFEAAEGPVSLKQKFAAGGTRDTLTSGYQVA
jgi:hypothetical protein